MVCLGSLICSLVCISSIVQAIINEVPGYTPSAESLDAIGNMVDRLREVNPELVYGGLRLLQRYKLLLTRYVQCLTLFAAMTTSYTCV